MAKGGYATDPNYANLVIGIMQTYDLYQYNLVGDAQIAEWVGADAEYWRPTTLPTVEASPSEPVKFVAGSDFPAYAIGVTEQGVKTMQRLLNEKNAAGLVADGIFGKNSDTAVRAWQSKNGFKVTGVMDDPAWNALLPMLAVGAKGQSVYALQEELLQAKVAISVTGTFDAQTKVAVEAFQRRQMINVDGEVGTAVWARLLDY